jgi:hypothetical protein
MDAHALLSYFSLSSWRSEPQKKAREFPPEAYSYDDDIDPKIVAAIQKKADEKLDQQEWTVIERIEDGIRR